MAWNFGGKHRSRSNGEKKCSGAAVTVREMLGMMRQIMEEEREDKPVVPLAHGDPSSFPAFRTPPEAEDAVVEALRSGRHNSYTSSIGLLSARRAVAEYVGHGATAEEVYLTSGCMQAIEIVIEALGRNGDSDTNILLPRPGFPFYERRAAWSGVQVRHFDLLPGQGWEVDLASVEAAADSSTAAIFIINPGNPTGAVYSRAHLEDVACAARKLGIMVVSDEVYDKLAFKPSFVSMAEFASIAPVLTLGSISKTLSVPGWRLGWIAAHDPDEILRGGSGVLDCVEACLSVSADPATFVQAAIPRIAAFLSGKAHERYASKMTELLAENADMCYRGVARIPCLACPHKPQGSMFIMVKLDASLLDEDISDDLEFCLKLAKEEWVMILPGLCVGMKSWVRISFAVETSILRDGLQRLQSFCERHSSKERR